MRRREFITFLGGAVAAWPLTTRAQKSLPRIGWLVYGGATLGPIDRSLKDALAQTGLVDGRNIEIVFRYANGKPDQLAGLASDSLRKSPIFWSPSVAMLSSRCSRRVKGAYPSSVASAITRCVRELPCLWPGQANFTGVTYLTDEMAAKRMEFLKEVAPDTRRVAVIFNPQHFDDEVTFARRGAESLGIALTTHPINSAAGSSMRRCSRRVRETPIACSSSRRD